MTTKLLVRQGGGAATEVDFANDFNPRKGAPFFQENTPLLRMGQRWADGEAAQGEFLVVDPNATESTAGFRIRPWAEVRLTEDASGDELTLAWMRFTSRDVQRRGLYVGGDEVEHTPQLMDCNVDLRGIPFRNGWERPAETDIERLEALFERKLSGSSSTAPNIFRITTDITFDSFANGHLAEHNTPVDMEAWTYPPGTEVSEVLAHIADEAGKQWGVVLHHDGGSTHKCLLYVDDEDLDRWTTDVRISDDSADWDPDDPTAPTFEPHWLQGAGREADFNEVITGLINIYGGTTEDPRTVYVETGEAPEDQETWVGIRNDDETRTEGGATRHANHYLTNHRNPRQSNKVSVLVKAAQAHLVTAGQAIQIKSVVTNTGADKETFKWRRVAECIVEPAADGLYWLHLSLERPRKGFGGGSGGGRGQPAATSPKPPPECTPEPTGGAESVCLTDADDGDSAVWPGTYFTVGTAGFEDFAPYWSMGSGQTENLITNCGLEAGHTYHILIDCRTNSKYAFYGLKFFTNGNDDGTANGTRIAAFGPTGSVLKTDFQLSGQFTIPTDATQAWVTFESTWGGWHYNRSDILEDVDPPDVGEDDEFCIPAGTGGSSPYYARSDDPRFDNDDQHLISKIQTRSTNNSGGDLLASAVVIADPSFTASNGVTTTTDAAQSAQRVGLLMEDTPDGEVGIVLWEGHVRIPVAGATGAADLDYLYTSSVAGEAETSATRSAGAFGQVIFDDADSPYIQWWGVPDASDAAEIITDHGDLTGLADDDHPQYYRTTDGGKDVINVVAASGATETLDLGDGNFHDVTLTADCTLTLSGATNGTACYMTILLRQGSGAPWEVTWPGSVEWVGGSAPVLETAEDAWNVVSLVTLDGGTTWFGDGGGGGSASLSDDTPLPISGSGDPGVATEASRSDHVHPSTGLVGGLLIADDATSPITFDDILQLDEGVGLLYADV